MKTLQGKGVFGGIAIGRIQMFHRQDASVKRVRITDVSTEQARFEAAKERTLQQLAALYEKAIREVGESGAQIFEIHQMMLEDEDYNDSVRGIIETQQVNAEYAVAVTADNFAAMFSAMTDDYMHARAADVQDISNRLITNFSAIGAKQEALSEKVILFADDLAPSETVQLDKENLLAFVTEGGSSNSHTAILARTMNIPAIVKAKGAFDDALNGKMAVVDGFSGTIYLDPTEEILEEMKKRQEKDRHQKALLEQLKGKENVTLDGTSVHLYANIGGIGDIGAVLLNDAGGIGLFRSEFLYLEQNTFPTEEQQFQAYRKVLESMVGKKVIIRTLDIGADKQIDYFQLAKEENPAMGMRAIRICLTRPEIFRTQLRALLRASVYGNLGIMFPMITSVAEVKQIRQIVAELMSQLDEDGVPYRKDVELGIMIETPAAAVISDLLAPEVDFFSVGTNDLTQYTLACDRQNAALEPFCDTHHEAILRLIRHATESAHRYGKWIGICGELAADLTLTEQFLKMGIDELSVSPACVLPLREKIRSIRLG